jgi:predicted lipid-binding transport protein (Tim44 family)
MISLLNCLGKLREKVMANMISKHCMNYTEPYIQERTDTGEGQSAVDAVGVLMDEVQEAWGRGQIAAALMMDVKSALPSVEKECLVKEMREMGLDENLVE